MFSKYCSALYTFNIKTRDWKNCQFVSFLFTFRHAMLRKETSNGWPMLICKCDLTFANWRSLNTHQMTFKEWCATSWVSQEQKKTRLEKSISKNSNATGRQFTHFKVLRFFECRPELIRAVMTRHNREKLGPLHHIGHQHGNTWLRGGG